jgi:protease-4
MGQKLGLVDRIGSLQDAIDCAARMARTDNYRLAEYPEPKGFLDRLLGNYRHSVSVRSAMKDELGEDGYRTYMTIKKVKSMVGKTQTRLPFDLVIE